MLPRSIAVDCGAKETGHTGGQRPIRQHDPPRVWCGVRCALSVLLLALFALGTNPTIVVLAATPTVTGVIPSSGTTGGGTSVTITGTNVTGATAVTFGGTNATSFTVVSSRFITATTPAKGAGGAVTITVTTPGGTANSPTNFTYVGTLSITTAPANFSYSATLSGDPLTLTSSFAVRVNDATGSTTGWNLQA